MKVAGRLRPTSSEAKYFSKFSSSACGSVALQWDLIVTRAGSPKYLSTLLHCTFFYSWVFRRVCAITSSFVSFFHQDPPPLVLVGGRSEQCYPGPRRGHHATLYTPQSQSLVFTD